MSTMIDLLAPTEEEEIIIPNNSKEVEKINYQDILPENPPYFLYMIDWSTQLTMEVAKKFLKDINYVSIDKEICQGTSYVIEFDNLDEFKRAHNLDQSILYGKSLKMSLVRY
ncbi:MAG: hypothetical protein MHPSP_003223, partial [Paramarteilia canceri]